MKNVEKTVENFRKEFNLKGTLTARKLKTVIKKMNCELFTYEANEGLLEKLKLFERAKYNPSVSCSVGDRNYIFYRGTISDHDLPFVLSHEIGHAYMNHLNRSDGYDDTSDRKDAEANVFATRLLYPQKQKKSKASLAITLATMLLSLFALSVVGTGVFDNLALPVAPEPSQNVSEQSSSVSEEDADFLNTLIIKVENEAASAEEKSSAQSEYSAPQPDTAQEVATKALDTSEQVLVTSSGTKYHKPSCGYVKHKTNTTRCTLAEAKYYAPCSRCFK